MCFVSWLSLTAHWVDTVSPSIFTLQSVVLQANEFPRSNTGTSIAQKIEMLIKGKIPKSNIHIVLQNITGNLKEAMDKISALYWQIPKVQVF